MKHIKLFENYSDLINKEDIARDFVNQYNTEYNYVIFKNDIPQSGWEYINDAIENGLLENGFGYSLYDLSDNIIDMIDSILLEYDDEDLDDQNNWLDFISDINNIISIIKNENEIDDNFSIVRI